MPAQKYPNPPIQEALVEVRFSNDGRWDWTIPGRYWEQVRQEYDMAPKSEPILTVQARQQASHLSAHAAGGVGRVLLTRSSDAGLIGLSPNALSVHVLRPYLGWAEFRERLARALDAYLKIQEDALVERVGVRYVNQIIIPGRTLDINDWFTASPALPPGLNLPINSLMSRVETTFDDTSRLSITLATTAHTNVDEHAFVLDMDLSWSPQAPVPLTEDVYHIIDLLHDREGTTFEAMITPDTRELFQ
jgi:uncharacterized protein (TIGR04255 family)